MQPHHALTVRYNGHVATLGSHVSISLPLTQAEIAAGAQLNAPKYNAIWDTGATSSVITNRIVTDLALKPFTLTQVHHVNGTSTANVYMVNVILPNNVTIEQVPVTEGRLAGGADVLIGMDIIGMGDFAVSNVNGKTVLTYRIPSAGEIDFVQSANRGNALAFGNRSARRAAQKHAKKQRKP